MPSLSAAQRAKVRRLSQPKELSPDEEGGELNIVPFLDIIMNVLIFVLASVAVTFTATIESNPPSSRATGGTRQDEKKNALNLTVFIVNDGFSIKASGGNVAPGCTGVGTGLAVPLKSGRYDFAQLTKCAAKLKGSNPDYEAETQVSLSANPGTDYQTIISAIDALRTSEQGDPLFDDVNFKVPR